METTTMNFDCTHDHVQGTMTCSWLSGRVKLVEYFALAKTYVLIDDKEKCRYDDLTVKEFMNLQVECQKVANEIEGGSL